MFKNFEEEKIIQVQKETFVASIGHDLKNPTIAQIRALELLLSGQFGVLSNEQKAVIDMILDSCNYMNAMLSSLLATYKSDCGETNLHYDELLLSELSKECVGEMIYIAKNKNVGIYSESMREDVFVHCDKVQIRRVIMNLLSNGIKYAYKDTAIKIRIFNENNYIFFEFENKSPYIPPKKQKAIFARYVSFAETHKELGVGLGLYASRKIIDAHYGELYVKSFEDDRNIFGFKIPIQLPKGKPQKLLVF